MEEGGKALARGLTSALQKLKQVAQLPAEDVLTYMTVHAIVTWLRFGLIHSSSVLM
jgi:hypothetical protein